MVASGRSGHRPPRYSAGVLISVARCASDHGQCVSCGLRGRLGRQPLESHHIYDVATFGAAANQAAAMELLCRSCRRPRGSSGERGRMIGSDPVVLARARRLALERPATLPDRSGTLDRR
jgi:5-methylcytosine-specific restriction endonuclease McrA